MGLIEYFSKPPQKKTINIANRVTTFALLFLGAAILVYISFLYNQSVVFFNRTPWDGTFQTLFPLRKMDAGEFPGRDFFYFHGNGIPYVLYPIYASLKSIGLGEILAALHSTYILNTIALFWPIYVLLRMHYERNIALLAVIVILVLFDFVPFVGAYFSPLFLGAPMGLRFLPHMLIAIGVGRFILKQSESSSLREKSISILKLSLLGSLGVYLGAEQGFYAVGGAAIAIFIYYCLNKDFLAAFILPSCLVVGFFALLIATSLLFFQSLESLRAISVISNDQVWVFGVFPNSFFVSFSELFSLDNMSAIPSQIVTVLATLYLIAVFLMYRRKVINAAMLASLSVLFFGGLLSWVSNVGYIGAHQTALLMRFVLIGLVPLGVLFLVKCKLHDNN